MLLKLKHFTCTFLQSLCAVREIERERERERGADRESETERQQDSEKETERDRERSKHTKGYKERLIFDFMGRYKNNATISFFATRQNINLKKIRKYRAYWPLALKNSIRRA